MHPSSHATEKDLLLFLDGELPPEPRAWLAEHLAHCAECRDRMDAADRTMRTLVDAHQRGVFAHSVAGRPGSRAALGWGRAKEAAAGIAILAVGVAALLSFRQAGESGAILPSTPRQTLTPGATVTTDARALCGVNRELPRSAVPESLERQVLRAYGVSHPATGAFEVDYLITPELGGAASAQNLWPEPYRHTVWNAHVKDQLEAHLHDLVCAGEVELPTAQHEIATDWIAAYKKYFHRSTPIPAADGASKT